MNKKILTIITISGFCLSALMLILGVFGVEVFEGVLLDILITLACIGIGGFFAINSINVYDKNKALSITSLALIGVSILGILIVSYFSIEGDLFGQLVFTIAMLSVLFNVIVSNVLQFGKKLLALQIVVYAVLLITIIFAVVAIFGVDLGELSKLLIALIILSLVGVIVLSILKKKNITTIGDNYIKITKQEYEELLRKASEYDKLQNENK